MEVLFLKSMFNPFWEPSCAIGGADAITGAIGNKLHKTIVYRSSSKIKMVQSTYLEYQINRKWTIGETFAS